MLSLYFLYVFFREGRFILLYSYREYNLSWQWSRGTGNGRPAGHMASTSREPRVMEAVISHATVGVLRRKFLVLGMLGGLQD